MLSPTSTQVDRIPAVVVRISSLRCSDSPRLSGENEQHIRTLAQTERTLPPIVVHRKTMRVIDGMHRLRVAQMRGEHHILARLFDCSSDEAFLLAVHINTAHGLPLSLSDRIEAARRLLSAVPERSDRLVASASGLSASTVAGIRGRSTVRTAWLNTRVGKDGRVRSLDGTSGRQMAASLLAERPEASLREIAREVGLSPATVLDVRNRVRRGDNPLPARQRAAQKTVNSQAALAEGEQTRTTHVASAKRSAAPLESLRRDPSLRHNDRGRLLLHWLTDRADDVNTWRRITDAVPRHCVGALVALAREHSHSWGVLANELEASEKDPDEFRSSRSAE